MLSGQPACLQPQGTLGFLSGLPVLLSRLLNWNELNAPNMLMRMLGQDVHPVTRAQRLHRSASAPGVRRPWG